MKSIVVVLALCIATAIAPARAAPQAGSADAATQVLYRCEVGGKVTYTTVPQTGCVVIGTYAKAVPASVTGPVPTMGHGFYTNRQGQAVRRPARTLNSQAPLGASAQCRDGSYSFSAHHRGTCSHHGGVARWL
jgi:hypothetical protein